MNAEPTLDDLRRRIDDLDERLHDLIMERTEVGALIRAAKGNAGVGLRPTREAMVLRRLIGRHRGPFHRPSLVRIWREVFAATLRLQEPFSMSVYGEAEGQDQGYLALARDQFGSYTPSTIHETAQRVIDTVIRNQASAGILPLPRQDDVDPWWPHLMTEDGAAPRIVTRLPFAGPPGIRERDYEALVIAKIALEPSGNDRTFLGLDAEEPIAMARLGPALKGADLKATFTARWQGPQTPDSCLQLIELEGFLEGDDPRIGKALDAVAVKINRRIILGAYAVPFSGHELAEAATPPKGRRS